METKHTIKITKYLNKYLPGDGASAGQRFYSDLLRPEFEKAKKGEERLLINLNGLREWPSSFVKATFGKLAREYGSKKVLNYLEFESRDNPVRIEKVKYIIRTSGENKALTGE